MITAHITKVKGGWKMSIVNGVQPILQNIIAEAVFVKKVDAKNFAKSQNAKAWNYV